jgi:hypothetical protein
MLDQAQADVLASAINSSTGAIFVNGVAHHGIIDLQSPIVYETPRHKSGVAERIKARWLKDLWVQHIL